MKYTSYDQIKLSEIKSDYQDQGFNLDNRLIIALHLRSFNQLFILFNNILINYYEDELLYHIKDIMENRRFNTEDVFKSRLNICETIISNPKDCLSIFKDFF